MDHRDKSSASSSIQTLERFFSLIDSRELFDQTDPVQLRELRRETRVALEDLLIWNRPGLEEMKGIRWPYQGLKERYPVFLKRTESHKETFWKRQAQFFLAFLPFPNQWSWMLQIDDRYGDDPEILNLLMNEKRKIQDKIKDKPQKRFKLRHFCQVLKRYKSVTEKGVLRIFSLPYVWLHPQLLSRISQKYVLYLEPPMGVVFRHEWWRCFLQLDDPCIFGIGSEEDRAFLDSHPRIKTTSLAHGDFLENIPWKSSGEEKKYDIAFNATYDDMPRKRHELMLQLLCHKTLLHAEALFLGRGQEANVNRLRRQIKVMGLENRVTVLANLRRAEIPIQLNRCKMGVHLSLYENNCRSIYEFFRSDLPCVISSSMAGMNPEIFNTNTGEAVPDRELSEAIFHVLTHRESYHPRQWFLAHSGSVNSSQELNHIFKELFNRWGYEWNEDIVPLGSSGASRYVQKADYERFKDEFQWLLTCFQDMGGWSDNLSVD